MAISGEIINFKHVYALEGEYSSQAVRIARIFQKAINASSLELDLGKALQLVQEDPGMAVVGTLNQTLEQSTAEVSVMVDRLAEFLKTLLMVALTKEQGTQYSQAIKQSFTGLAVEKGEAWIFWQAEEAHKTTYQYNILFSIQNQATGSLMIALAVGLTIEVDIDKEKVLFITVKDKCKYSVKVQAITVAEALNP